MAVNLFPVGVVADASSKGTMDGISTFEVFEPNAGVKSVVSYNNLLTTFENQTMQTRKKSSPSIMIEYTYDNIFAREFRQIERFVSNMEESLTSFRAVDFSKGYRANTFVNSDEKWTIDNIYGKREFSATTNYKADMAFVWNGIDFKLGSVVGYNADDILIRTGSTAASYGNLTRGAAVF